MWDENPDTQAALQRLGLDRQSSLTDAKAAFRHQAKTLHPDHTPASEQTLLALAECIQAIRHLENCAPVLVEIELDPAEAASGLTRSLQHKGRSAVFRIEAGAQTGDQVAAIGDPSFQARIVLTGQPAAEPQKAGADRLKDFVSEFASREPSARFAGWLRKAHSAA